MIQEGYLYKNSIIHRMNPSLKMVSTIIFVILIFIPFGFFSQIILLSIIFLIYILSKLPFKKLWKIFVSILFMALLLGIINWISYKAPGVVFDIYDSFNVLGIPYWLKETNQNAILLDNKWFIHGDIWGGKIESNIFSNIHSSISSFISNIPGATFLQENSGNGFYIIDLNSIQSDNDINHLQNLILNGNPNQLFDFKLSESELQLFIFSYSTEWYGLSSFALTLMGYVTLKIFSMILVISILTSTTSSIEMTYALEDIMSPLKYLKAPISEWSMTIALSIRFIPSLLDESNRVLRAQASRGVDFKNGNILDKMKSLVSLVVPLFSIAFRKAEELSNAMESRAYNPRNNRTRYRIFSIHFFDMFMLGFLLFYLGLTIILMTIGNKISIFTPFGIHDVIIIYS